MGNVIYLEGTEQLKTDVLSFNGVVLLDFYADWCGPCQMIGPVMEELATDNAEKNVKIIKVNVDSEANRDIAGQFQVSSIPAVFVINAGKVVNMLIGANPKETYQAEIDKELAKQSTTGENNEEQQEGEMAA